MRLGRHAAQGVTAPERLPVGGRALPSASAARPDPAAAVDGKTMPRDAPPPNARTHAGPSLRAPFDSGSLQRELTALFAPQPSPAYRAGAQHSLEILNFLVDEWLPELALDPDIATVAAAMLREEMAYQLVVTQYADAARESAVSDSPDALAGTAS